MGNGGAGAAASGGAIYGLGIFGAYRLLAAGRRVLGTRLGYLPESHPLAGVHGLRGVLGPRRVTAVVVKSIVPPEVDARGLTGCRSEQPGGPLVAG
jgi:hypothetical protein